MFPRPDSIRPILMSVSVKTCFWERLRAWRSSRSCATTPRTTGSLYRSFFRRMVQRYVKFGNSRSPVAASFAALQKVRSAPPVTGFLSSTFCCSLSAVRCPLFAVRCSLSAVRCPLSAVRCLPLAARRSPLVACAYCSPAACYSPLSVCRHSPPSQLADRKQPLRGSIPLRQTRFCPDMR